MKFIPDSKSGVLDQENLNKHIMDRIEELKNLIKKGDLEYRKGTPIFSDQSYDSMVDELISLTGEDDEFFNSSIKEDDELISSDRREVLPEGTIMASMNKIKTINELNNWIRLKNIPLDSEFVITPKYDGISLLKNEKDGQAWTRGGKNVKGGLKSKKHLVEMGDKIVPDTNFSYGECIISRENFKKYITENDLILEQSSSRNIASGFFRRDECSDDLCLIDFVRYGIFDDNKKFYTKKEILDYLNKHQKVKVPYKINKFSELTESYLQEIYKEFSKDYEIDGLIIEVNDIELCNKLGREKSGNPKFAVAFKSVLFEEEVETVILDIENNISKNGNIIPVAILKPVNIGVNISRATLNNYSFIREMGCGIGSSVLIRRGGSVIPVVVRVTQNSKKDFVMPDIECEWDENGTHLRTIHETDDQRKKRILAFFRIMKVEDFSDKTIDLLFDSGYKTIKDILSMSKEDFLKLDGFKDKKSSKIFKNIHDRMSGVELCKLQHASSLFTLGSKKLVLLEHFETKPTLEEITLINGFSDISANDYLNNIDEFNSFYEEIKQFVTIKKTEKIIMENNKLEGKVVVFTGFRDKVLEMEIMKQGAKVTTSVSKNTTHLIMAEKNSGSQKEQRAIEFGATILDRDELIELLGI